MDHVCTKDKSVTFESLRDWERVPLYPPSSLIFVPPSSRDALQFTLFLRGLPGERVENRKYYTTFIFLLMICCCLARRYINYFTFEFSVYSIKMQMRTCCRVISLLEAFAYITCNLSRCILDVYNMRRKVSRKTFVNCVVCRLKNYTKRMVLLKCLKKFS